MNVQPQGGAPVRQAQDRALWIALLANGGFALAEVAGGFVFRSLALLADAAHMLVDVGGLGIALVAHRMLARPSSARHTYGLQRAEVLAALANGVLILVVSAFILVEAVERFADAPVVRAGGLLAVASVGLVVNVGSAVLIARSQSGSLNMRGALIHMLADAAGSVVVIAAGVGALLWAAYWVDPAASILIVVLLLWPTWRLVREALHVLMEGAPAGMDPGEVERALADQGDVEAVHHLHLWNLASDTPALSAHVVLRGEVTLHEAQVRGERLKWMLAERFGIEHSTLELECHECEPAPGEVGHLPRRG